MVVLNIPIKEEKLFSWEEVYYFVSTNQIKRLHRSKRVQAKYDEWRKKIIEQYGSIERYLLTTTLHFNPTTIDVNRPEVIILPNDFPYAVAHDIRHILLWSQTPLSREYIDELLELNFGSQHYNWVYWVNPPEIQSVRKLPHVHVFILIK